MKLINPAAHAVLDYGLALAVFFAPIVFGVIGTAATLAYVTGGAYIVAALLTRYPLGILKLIPFPVHGVLEALMALAWLASPWVLGFAHDAGSRNFFIAAGVLLLGVVALTDYKAGEPAFRPERRQRDDERRRQLLSITGERRTRMADRRSRRYARA